MRQLEVKSLTKSFEGSRPVLESLSFWVDQGEFLVVLGPSGCGKSTLLRIIAGLEKADSGKVFIAGADITNTEPKRRNIAMVFQNYALYPHMTVYENLAFALKMAKIPKPRQKENVYSTATMLGLEDLLKRKPKQLSGGQRQRVALGRAIIRNPAIFLFDEPLSNLDAELRMKMRSEILALHRRIGGTSLYVTHDQVEAMSLADRIMILNNSRQIGPEKPRALYDFPPDTFTASFLGNPGMNLIEVKTTEDGHHIRIDDEPPFEAGTNLPPNSKVIYGFRPEDCSIEQSGQISAEIIGLEDTGKEYIIELLGANKTRLFCLSDKKYMPGSKLYLKVKKAIFFDSHTSRALQV